MLGAGPEDEGPLLVLNGHLDTVGVEGMTVEPFGAELRDGRILGRGACDMKAGVAALMAAAASAAGRGGPDAGTLVVALTADEEHASIGMQAFAAELRRRLEHAPRDPAAVAAVVCEPTGLAVMPAHKGFVWLDAVFRGRAAHGSRPEVGVDAVRHAALWIAELEGLHGDLASGASHPLLGRPSFHVGTIDGGTAPSVYPAGCHVTVERRTLPAEDPDEVVEPFRRALDRVSRDHPEVSGELTVDLIRPGSDVPPDSTVVRALGDALREEGMEARIEGMTAWVDAAFLNEAGIPAVCFGPGSIEQAHSADEYVEVQEVRAAAAVLGRMVEGCLRP
jgi:acetylornithine deacetylase